MCCTFDKGVSWPTADDHHHPPTSLGDSSKVNCPNCSTVNRQMAGHCVTDVTKGATRCRGGWLAFQAYTQSSLPHLPKLGPTN